MRQTLFIFSLQQGLKQKKAQTNENGLKTIVIGNTIVVRRARYVYARPPLIEGFLKRSLHTHHPNPTSVHSLAAP
jgi:hypothetical protein